MWCEETTGPNDSIAASVYELSPDPMRVNLGKIGYVDNEGRLQLYPDSMTGFAASYTSIGAYNVSGSNLGTSTSVTDANACQQKCNEYNNQTDNNNSDKCAGVVFDTANLTCQMKDNTVFQNGIRVINNNYQYYLRTKSIVGNDISCPSDVTQYTLGTTADWADMTKDTKMGTKGMTPTTKCGLANYTQAERTDLDNSNDALETNLNQPDGIKSNINALNTKYNLLTGMLARAKTSLRSMFNELTGTKNNVTLNDQIVQLDAMNEDRDLNMLSQSYKYIMWSILAILVVIGTIKMTRKTSGAGASASSSSAVAASTSVAEKASSALSSILPGSAKA